MLVASHSLGEIEHIYRHRLKLTTKGDIELSYPRTDSSSSISLPGSVEDLVSKKAWITCGNSLEITFVIELEGVRVDGGSISDHSENLGLRLRDAELWSQLSLTPSLKIPKASSDQHVSSIVACLKLRPHNSIEAGIRQTSKSDDHESLDPPAGILAAVIKNIDVRLQISQCPLPGTARLKRKRGHDPSSRPEDSATHHGGSDNASLEDGTQLRNSREPAAFRHVIFEDLEPREASRASISPTWDSSVKFEELPLAQGPLTVDAKDQDLVPLSPSSSQLITFTELSKFVNSSLRCLLFNPHREAQFMLSSEKNHAKKLNQIAPALFSPGFLQAISCRRSFLTTISATITDFGSSARSATLHQILQQLRRYPSDGFLQGFPSSTPSMHVDGSTSSKIIEIRLWLLLQKSLYDDNACTKLKSLSTKWKPPDTADANCLLDTEVIQGLVDGVEITPMNEDTNYLMPSFGQAEVQEGSPSTQDLPQDLLDDRLESGEDHLCSSDEILTQCLEHQEDCNDWLDTRSGGPYQAAYDEHEDEQLFGMKPESQEEPSDETHGFTPQDKAGEDFFSINSQDGETLLDGTCDDVCEGEDEDLFWGDLIDHDDLLDDLHPPSSTSFDFPSPNLGSSGEFLDLFQQKSPSFFGESPKYENDWLDMTDVPDTNSTHSNQVQGSDTLLAI